MKKHDFTPQQGEAILNAFNVLVGVNFNAYSFARFVNDLCSDLLLHSIEIDEGQREIALDPYYFERIVLCTHQLSDFLFEAEDILAQNPINAIHRFSPNVVGNIDKKLAIMG